MGYVWQVSKNTTHSWAACTMWWLTCRISIQDPCHYNHFIWLGSFTCQHDTCCHNGKKAVADHGLFSEEGTRITLELYKLRNRAQHWVSCLPSQHAWDKPDTDCTTESSDSVHGDNKRPDHGDGLRRGRLCIPVIPAAVDETLYVLKGNNSLLIKLQKLISTWGRNGKVRWGFTGEGELSPVRW